MDPVHIHYLDKHEPTLEQVFPSDWVAYMRRPKHVDWRPDMMAQGKQVVYGGWFWESETLRDVVDVGAGAGAMTCGECQGSGIFQPPDVAPIRCPTCGGGGRTFVTL